MEEEMIFLRHQQGGNEAVNGIEVAVVMSLCSSNTQLKITCLISPQQLSFSGGSDCYFLLGIHCS